ncbi:MAG: PstS family phosphate ABC transporter substrate-binding protein [Opitutales bacterium]
MKAKLTALALLTLALTVAMQAEEIRVAASDLLADAIRGPLESSAELNQISLRLDAIGSLPAIDRLRSDEIDLAIIAVPEGKEVPQEALRIYPFAYDASVIVTNESNPIDEISLGRLAGIYGANEESNFNAWGELGLSGWGNRNIKPFVGVESESISLELFRYTVLSRGAMKRNVGMVHDAEVEDLVASDSASIAIMSRLPESRQLKVLMLSSAANAPAFGPTNENIHFGDYPIRLAFYIAFNPGDSEKLNATLRALFSDTVADSLEASQLFPLPFAVRRQLSVDLELGRASAP